MIWLLRCNSFFFFFTTIVWLVLLVDGGSWAFLWIKLNPTDGIDSFKSFRMAALSNHVIFVPRIVDAEHWSPEQTLRPGADHRAFGQGTFRWELKLQFRILSPLLVHILIELIPPINKFLEKGFLVHVTWLSRCSLRPYH